MNCTLYVSNRPKMMSSSDVEPEPSRNCTIGAFVMTVQWCGCVQEKGEDLKNSLYFVIIVLSPF